MGETVIPISCMIYCHEVSVRKDLLLFVWNIIIYWHFRGTCYHPHQGSPYWTTSWHGIMSKNTLIFFSNAGITSGHSNFISGLTWLMVYRTEKYQKLKAEVERQSKRCKYICAIWFVYT